MKEKLTVTLPPDLLQWLITKAKTEKRSISNMLVVLLSKIKERG